MGFLNNFLRFDPTPDNQPRTLDDADYVSWFAAADRRTDPLSRDELIVEIKKRNPHRWWRIQYDYKWLRRQMKRLGQNPDDARELL